jgi:hypothetical protein
LSNFIASTGNGSNTIISVDANGGEAFETDISITLIGVTGVNLTSLISSGAKILIVSCNFNIIAKPLCNVGND